MTEREQLIADLAAAAEGSAALNERVALALGWECRPIQGGENRPAHIGGPFCWRRGDMSWTSDGETPPRYTQSIDAAVAEVPANWDFIIGRDDAWIWNRRSVSIQERVSGATPALALCRALLLAKESA